jgi:hypothetical protein
VHDVDSFIFFNIFFDSTMLMHHLSENKETLG